MSKSRSKHIIIDGPKCLSCRKEMQPMDKVLEVKDSTGCTQGWCCTKKCWKQHVQGVVSKDNQKHRAIHIAKCQTELSRLFTKWMSERPESFWPVYNGNVDATLEVFFEYTNYETYKK